MDPLIIEGTVKTPTVRLDPSKGKFEIFGKSIPEDTIGFYKPVMEALRNYTNSPAALTEVEIHLEYFNTSSAKCLVDILKFFAAILQKGNKVNINWIYEEDDEDMASVGEDLQYVSGLTFKMVPVTA